MDVVVLEPTFLEIRARKCLIVTLANNLGHHTWIMLKFIYETDPRIQSYQQKKKIIFRANFLFAEYSYRFLMLCFYQEFMYIILRNLTQLATPKNLH